MRPCSEAHRSATWGGSRQVCFGKLMRADAALVTSKLAELVARVEGNAGKRKTRGGGGAVTSSAELDALLLRLNTQYPGGDVGCFNIFFLNVVQASYRNIARRLCRDPYPQHSTHPIHTHTHARTYTHIHTHASSTQTHRAPCLLALSPPLPAYPPLLPS